MNTTAMKISTISQSSSTFLDSSSGEVIQSSETSSKTFRVPKVPSFVKLYLDCLSAFKDIQISLNPILIEFLKCSSYACCDDVDGGQTLYLNSALKKRIASKCDVSVSRINQAITEFVKKEYMYRVDVGTYQFNAELFGKGEWSDICNLRNIQANIDFASGTIQTEFIRKTVSDQEAHAMTEHLPFGVGDPEYDDGAEHFDEGFQLTFGADDNEQ